MSGFLSKTGSSQTGEKTKRVPISKSMYSKRMETTLVSSWRNGTSILQERTRKNALIGWFFLTWLIKEQIEAGRIDADKMAAVAPSIEESSKDPSKLVEKGNENEREGEFLFTTDFLFTSKRVSDVHIFSLPNWKRKWIGGWQPCNRSSIWRQASKRQLIRNTSLPNQLLIELKEFDKAGLLLKRGVVNSVQLWYNIYSKCDVRLSSRAGKSAGLRFHYETKS